MAICACDAHADRIVRAPSYMSIESQAKRFREELLRQEAATSNSILGAFQNAVGTLAPHLGKLRKELEAREKLKNKPVIPTGADHFNRLAPHLQENFAQFAEVAGGIAAQSQAANIELALNQNAELMGLDAPAQSYSAKELIGFAGDGSKLSDLFKESFNDTFKNAQDALIEGVQLGFPPKQVIENLINTFGKAAARSITIARTESIRAYREASREAIIEASSPTSQVPSPKSEDSVNSGDSETISGWIWWANLTPQTCPICWAMHGTKHSADEELISHPNCRCIMLPDDGSIDIKTGEERFNELSDEIKEEIIGKSKYEDFRSSGLNLLDLVGYGESERFGRYLYQRQITQIADALSDGITDKTGSTDSEKVEYSDAFLKTRGKGGPSWNEEDGISGGNSVAFSNASFRRYSDDQVDGEDEPKTAFDFFKEVFSKNPLKNKNNDTKISVEIFLSKPPGQMTRDDYNMAYRRAVYKKAMLGLSMTDEEIQAADDLLKDAGLFENYYLMGGLESLQRAHERSGSRMIVGAGRLNLELAAIAGQAIVQYKGYAAKEFDRRMEKATQTTYDMLTDPIRLGGNIPITWVENMLNLPRDMAQKLDRGEIIAGTSEARYIGKKIAELIVGQELPDAPTPLESFEQLSGLKIPIDSTISENLRRLFGIELPSIPEIKLPRFEYRTEKYKREAPTVEKAGAFIIDLWLLKRGLFRTAKPTTTPLKDAGILPEAAPKVVPETPTTPVTPKPETSIKAEPVVKPESQPSVPKTTETTAAKPKSGYTGEYPPKPPTGKKPPIKSEGARDFRYRRYVYEKFKAGAKPEEILSEKEWAPRYHETVKRGGRSGRAGGPDQVATRQTLKEAGFTNTETTQLGQRTVNGKTTKNMVDMYKPNKLGGIDYVEVDVILKNGLPVGRMRGKVIEELKFLKPNDRLIYVDKVDPSKRIIYSYGESPSTVTTRKATSGN